jgi:hypothetical protein
MIKAEVLPNEHYQVFPPELVVYGTQNFRQLRVGPNIQYIASRYQIHDPAGLRTPCHNT